MHYILFCMLVLLCTSCASITPTVTPSPYTEVKDAYGNTQLLGKGDRYLLNKTPYRTWYQTGYETYTVDRSLVEEIAPLLKKKKMELFLGTWCGDSRREVPRMLKILDEAGVDSSRVQLIFVSNAPDMYKQSPQHEEAGKQIKRVPTLIIYEDGKEIGRIVEYPVQSLEKDLLTVLRKQPYTPNYSNR